MAGDADLRAHSPLQYPADEVLQQLELGAEERKSLGRKKYQRFIDELNTRLAQLQSDG
ncbi:MAG: hypothetical protein J2P56_09230 [Verrucomicrobia bacterium]|nr:hypothetical protein [Verrucomicrobiota bacterium]